MGQRQIARKCAGGIAEIERSLIERGCQTGCAQRFVDHPRLQWRDERKRPMITNSVVPMPKEAMASASRARREEFCV
jgi:hypothetical protein